MTEQWKPIRGWPAYEVSNMGRVRSIDRLAPNGGGRFYSVPGRLLTPRIGHNGYLVVTLRAGIGTRSTPMVHRLVAEAFVPNPLMKPNVNHLDCNPSNPAADNLEWCTQQENLDYMRLLGRQRSPKGKRPPVAKLTDDEVREIRAEYLRGGSSHQSIATKFGVSKRSIGRILNDRAYADVR